MIVLILFSIVHSAKIQMQPFILQGLREHLVNLMNNELRMLSWFGTLQSLLTRVILLSNRHAVMFRTRPQMSTSFASHTLNFILPLFWYLRLEKVQRSEPFSCEKISCSWYALSDFSTRFETKWLQRCLTKEQFLKCINFSYSHHETAAASIFWQLFVHYKWIYVLVLHLHFCLTLKCSKVMLRLPGILGLWYLD